MSRRLLKKVQMQGGEEARSETYLDVRCNDERRSQRRRWAFFSSLLEFKATADLRLDGCTRRSHSWSMSAPVLLVFGLLLLAAPARATTKEIGPEANFCTAVNALPPGSGL